MNELISLIVKSAFEHIEILNKRIESGDFFDVPIDDPEH